MKRYVKGRGKRYAATLLSAAMVMGSIYGNDISIYANEESTDEKVYVRQEAEHLTDRALMAMEVDGGVYLNWRLFDTDSKDISFTLYKVLSDGSETVVATDLTVTNYVDSYGVAGDKYYVEASEGEKLKSDTAIAWSDQYIEYTLDKPEDEVMPDGSTCTYTANDMSVADLDGDGDYEIIVKWYPSNANDNSIKGYTGKTFIDAYDIDTSTAKASIMWRIDLGINIRSGAHYTQFQVYDYDGDGIAELAVKTADGTTAYTYNGEELEESGYVGECNSESLATDVINEANDYRNSSGYVLSGPEYLTVFDGLTGSILDTVEYTPARGTVSSWGDSYGNRVDRFLACTAYLDGENPSFVFCRGYYTRSCLTAYRLVDKKIVTEWIFDSNTAGSAYKGQGNHSVSVNDVDGDGRDEIVYGSMVVDDDGTPLYSTGLGHGDAIHVGDYDMDNDGLEIFQVHEEASALYQVELHDAATGDILWGYATGKDTGRGLAADIDPTSIGTEMWSSATYDATANTGGVSSSKGETLSTSRPSVNFSIYWDGDLTQELLDHTYISSTETPVSVNITKWDYENSKVDTIFTTTEAYSNNGTKGNPCLAADILGDWREEIIVRSAADNSKVRLYATDIKTDYSIPCLMTDSTYRLGIAWQNTGYNQPAHTSYCISANLVTASISRESVTKDSITISWTSANDGDYGHDIEKYEIYSKNDEGEYNLLAVTEADVYSYTFTGLEQLSDYTYAIAAVVDGKTSYMSRPITICTSTDAAQVINPEDVEIIVGTKYDDKLPKTITIINSAGESYDTDVVWNTETLDINSVGDYIVEGTIADYEDAILLNVHIKEDYIISVDSLKEESVEMSDIPYEITDSEVMVNYASGKTEKMEVIWDTPYVDISSSGTKSATGKISGCDIEVTKIINVKYPVLYRFDFGISSSTSASGWTTVTVNSKSGSKTADSLGITYSTEKGYGFLNGSAVIKGRSESYSQDGDIPSNVYRDFVIPDGNTFAIDVENGIYQIEYVVGSEYSGTARLYVEDDDTLYTTSNAAKSYSIGKIEDVKVIDGQLNLSFVSGSTSRIDAIIISQVEIIADIEEPKTEEPGTEESKESEAEEPKTEESKESEAEEPKTEESKESEAEEPKTEESKESEAEEPEIEETAPEESEDSDSDNVIAAVEKVIETVVKIIKNIFSKWFH